MKLVGIMDSRTYWRLREEKWIKESIKRDKDLSKEVKRVLQRAYSDIQKDIDAFYGRYSNKEGISITEARKKVANHDVKVFADKAKQYVKTKDFSPRANEELRLYNLTMKVNRLELLKAEINLRMIESTDEINQLIANESYQQAIIELERNAGILGDSTGFDVEQRAKQVLNGSYQLPDSPTLTTFSDNIWLYKTELVNDLEKLLVRSFTQGQNPRIMARELKKTFDVYGYQAERLARTEMSELASLIQDDSFKRNEIDEYEYIAEPSACKLCAGLNRTIHKVKDAQKGVNSQPMHPNCKCSKAPYIDPMAMYKDWLERGIITDKEYASQKVFLKQFDTEFEKLMEQKEAHELAMAGKRKNRLPKDHQKNVSKADKEQFTRH